MHWYDSLTGEPRYEIPYANGRPGMREPTLTDAKKLKTLAPGVTSVMGIIARDGLVNWQIEQAILAALTHPKLDGLTHTEMLAVIRRDAQEQARKAAQRGTEIHDAIEKYMAHGIEHPDYAWHVKGAVQCLADHTGPQIWTAEAHLPGGLGYGGRVDLHSDEWVIDFKTKEFTQADVDSGKIKGWPEQHVQLVAYDHGLNWPIYYTEMAADYSELKLKKRKCRKLANIFVSTTEPGLAVFWEWPPEDYDTGLVRWNTTLEAWYAWKWPEGRLVA